ncbi:MAG TPA: hypothetical protein VHZ26_00570 [Caulobacteraceae bacterium]|jgi:hypothetical protein|nr:hypothetical protein [Caulobacteraceae bacterium]
MSGSLSTCARLAGATILAAAAASGAAAGTVQLRTPPPIAPDNAALPRIAAPATPQTARINASLARIDQTWRGFMKDCLGHGKASEVQLNRSVEVTLAGPRYVSIVAHDSEWCDGANNPSNSALALVYDLDAGKPVDWKALLGPRLVATEALDNSSDGTTIGTIAGPALQALYVAAVKADPDIKGDKDWWSGCSEALTDPSLAFVAWPDAKKAGLVVTPSGLPHVVTACAEDEVIPLSRLRADGADPGFIAAIAAGG